MRNSTGCNARNRHRPLTTAALVLVVSVAGATANGTESLPAKNDSHAHKWTQVGKASWYGRRFQGHRTASGEPFDLNMLTCAHRTLPIGTLLRVTNLGTRRSIVVRVNDRGPVPKGIIVDLSFAAARSLGFNGRGSARVRLERVEGAEAAQLDWPELMKPEAVEASR